MEAVAWTTVILAAAIVATLALSLLAILYYLIRVGTLLAAIASELQVVAQQTASFDACFAPLVPACRDTLAALEDAAAQLDRASTRLHERFGAKVG